MKNSVSRKKDNLIVDSRKNVPIDLLVQLPPQRRYVTSEKI